MFYYYLGVTIRGMDLHQTRQANMAYLGDDVYGRNGLAEALGYSDVNYINGIIAGHTNLGTRNASKFGVKLGLGENWFNVLHPELWGDNGASDNSSQYDTSPHEARISSALDALTDEDTDLILALIKRLAIKGASDRQG